MKAQPKFAAAAKREWLPEIFAGLFGAFLGLLLLKFGNVPIMENVAIPLPTIANGLKLDEGVRAPQNIWEFLFNSPWPVAWVYRLLGLFAILGLFAARLRQTAPRWLLALPMIWLVWQLFATTHSLDGELSWPTVKHFAGCVVCFYLGCFSLSRVERLSWFWFGLFCGFLLVLACGVDQHFGGLERYRIFFQRQLELYPPTQPVRPDLLKRVASDRIYSTLFYPNVLAGALLLLLPAMIAAVREMSLRVSTAHKAIQLAVIGLIAAGASWLYLSDSKVGLAWLLLMSLAMLVSPPRWVLEALVGAAGLACLYWSGSKGGWLVMLLLGLIVLLRLPIMRMIKVGLLSLVLLAGLAGFFWKYSAFFKKGATSVSARFDYWQAALQTTRENPILGTGPGTFSIPYAKIKRPESEMARLVHNDYLEQASDSGLPGFAFYTVFIVGSLVWSFPRSKPEEGPKAESRKQKAEMGSRWEPFAIWLGLLGWSLQSLFEFGLYIPALAWPAFALLGWLLGRGWGRDQAPKTK
jgi:hypothetical protein